VATVNIDQEPRWASTFGVTELPNLILFKQSQEVQRLCGTAPKRILKEAFNAVLAS
jgi:thioredoxin-like negative regulator of GroEL